MRVLYVWDSEYPWDVRTEKICRTLVQHGHEVVITARNRRGEPRRETRPEGEVHRLPSFARIIRNPLSFPAFFNPFWLTLLRRITVSDRIEVIIVRDLPLAPAALWASGGRCPVILDMAENYPAMISDIWTDGRARFLDVVVRNPRLVALIERFTIRRVAHIFTVVEESRLRLLQLGVSEEHVSVLSNTPSLDRVRPLAPRLAGEPLRLVYLGLMEWHRGVATLLQAARRLSTSGVQFRLDLVGDGRDYEQFRDYALQLGLDGNQVIFHGRLPHDKAIRLVESAHVGVVPHLATASWNTTIPNKLFDYMAAGLAVVSSDAKPAARIITETEAGVVFRSGDERDLADQLSHMVALEPWDRCRRAGQAAIRSRYNWEVDSNELLTVVHRISARETGRRRVSGDE
ncbi:MAG: glycosyltransferase family 4 protein [Gemmatimonadales bacterium]